MKLKITFLLAFFCLSFFNYAQSSKKVIVLDDRIHLPDSFSQSAKKHLLMCADSWHLLYDTIIIDRMENFSHYSDLKDSSKVFAVTERNKIFFRYEVLKKMNVFDFKNCFKHEVFHTLCGPVTLFNTPYLYITVSNDTFALKGFEGLILRVNDVAFTGFNEAAASYASYAIDGQQSPDDYAKIGYLLSRMVVAKWITVADMVKANKESDLYYFCSKILNKKQVTLDDICHLAEDFDAANAGNPNEVFKRLQKERSFSK